MKRADVTVALGDVAALLAEAPVRAFVDAVDRAMNSNTVLMAFTVAATEALPLTGLVDPILASDAFGDGMYAVDRIRGWDNHHDGDVVDGAWVVRPRPGRWLRDRPVRVHAITAREVRRRLVWMLTEAFSPYHTRPDGAAARALVDGFGDHLLGSASVECAGIECAEIEPTFLHSTGFFAPEPIEPSPLAYFDGGSSDTATAVRWGQRVWLLLTNGSP